MRSDPGTRAKSKDVQQHVRAKCWFVYVCNELSQGDTESHCSKQRGIRGDGTVKVVCPGDDEAPAAGKPETHPLYCGLSPQRITTAKALCEISHVGGALSLIRDETRACDWLESGRPAHAQGLNSQNPQALWLLAAFTRSVPHPGLDRIPDQLRPATLLTEWHVFDMQLPCAGSTRRQDQITGARQAGPVVGQRAGRVRRRSKSHQPPPVPCDSRDALAV